MKLLFKLVACIIVLPLNALGVKVLLKENVEGVVRVSSSRGFILYDGDSRKKIEQKKPTAEITLALRKDVLYINGQKSTRKSIILKPLSKHFSFENTDYDGYLLVTYYNKQWHIVNVIDSEKYVFSVLKTEGWPGWPLEVYKVFAIAVRTYVLHHYFESKKIKNPYHVRNTNHHQTYKGVHSCPLIKEAVEQTRNMVLTYGNKPILAMFDACCGGVVPAHIEGVIDFSKAPYLARPYACNFCKKFKLYSWQSEFTLDQLRDLLQEGHSSIIHDLHDIKIAQKDKAGLVKSVITKTKKKQTIQFLANSFNRLVKNLKSLFYSIEKKGDKVIIKGRGLGHHLGLCQWGVREMVNQGWQWNEILDFFYPGVNLQIIECCSDKA